MRALRDAHGRRAFDGDVMADVLSSVLTREPDLTALPASTPQSIRRLVRRCLEKGRDERLRDIGDARIEIRDALAGGDTQQEPDTSGPAPHRSRERLAWIGALAALTAALGGSLMFVRRPVPAAPEMRVDISTPRTMAPLSQAISPDGLTIAFVATSDGKSAFVAPVARVWFDAFFDGDRCRRVLFWSPDSRSIAFFAETKIKKVDVNWRVGANARNCLVGFWRFMERRRSHPLCRIGTADFAYPRKRRRTRRPDRTGPTREQLHAGVPPGWSAIPLLRTWKARSPWRLHRPARRDVTSASPARVRHRCRLCHVGTSAVHPRRAIDGATVRIPGGSSCPAAPFRSRRVWAATDQT